MDNSNPTRSKPVEYDAMKHVLKSMSMNKRREIHHRIPQLRAANSVLPYRLKHVSIGLENIRINNVSWMFCNLIDHETDPALADKTVLELQHYSEHGNLKRQEHFMLKESPVDEYTKLFDIYLQNKSFIKNLTLWEIPDFLKKRNPKYWRISTSDLKFAFARIDDYNLMFQLIDMKHLTCLELPVDEETISVLEKPEIIHCKKLVLELIPPYQRTVSDRFLQLQNEHLIIRDNDNLCLTEQLITDWIKNPRPIGTRLTVHFYFRYSQAYKNIMEKFRGGLPEFMTTEGIADKRLFLKIKNDTVLVMHIKIISAWTRGDSSIEVEVIEGVKPAEEGEPSEKKSRQE